jgi:hypothetical protein
MAPCRRIGRRIGDRLIVEPVHRKSLLTLLASWAPMAADLGDLDQGLTPLDDVEL